MAASSAFIIKYPSTVTVPSTLTTCYIMYNSVKYTMSSCVVDSTTSSIKISEGFSAAVSSAS